MIHYERNGWLLSMTIGKVLRFNVIAALVLVMLSGCNGNGYNDIREISTRRQCRANMNTLCTDQAKYRDTYGEWAVTIEQLDQDARRIGSLVCPENDEEYLLESSDSGYVLSCPAGHGSIDTGTRSWTGGH